MIVARVGGVLLIAAAIVLRDIDTLVTAAIAGAGILLLVIPRKR